MSSNAVDHDSSERGDHFLSAIADFVRVGFFGTGGAFWINQQASTTSPWLSATSAPGLTVKSVCRREAYDGGIQSRAVFPDWEPTHD